MVETNMEIVFVAALAEPFGLAIQLSDSESARRKAYTYRNQCRKRGDTRFDKLSFIIKTHSILLIYNRAVTHHSAQISITALKEMYVHEIPSRITARGKKKPGLLSEAILQSIIDHTAKR